MSATILQGNVFDLLPTLEPESIDCAVTSPPYYLLRSYLPKGHPLKHLELGSEPTVAEYIANMVKVFALVRRVMAPHATFWLNVGDSYSAGGNGGHRKSDSFHGHEAREGDMSGQAKRVPGIPAGNLCLIPQRLTIALQDDGWLVRSVIVWHKPACMPASLSGWAWRRHRIKTKAGWDKDHPHPSKNMEAGRAATCFARGRQASSPLAEFIDCPGCKKCSPHGGYVLRRGSWRPTSSWEPVLMLAKGPGYFSDGEPVKTPPAAATVSRDQYTRVLDDPDEQFAVQHDHETVCDGANARDVQTWAAEPLKEAHYAAFPRALVSFCLRAGVSAKGYCPACGAPWCRVVDVESWSTRERTRGTARGWSGLPGRETEGGQHGRYNMNGQTSGTNVSTLDWRPSCNCIGGSDMVPRPARVLDPFCGSGRTGIEARRLGLDFVGCELNPDYVEMAKRLLVNDSPLFAGLEA